MDLTGLDSYRFPSDRASLALTSGEMYLGGGTWLFSEPQDDVQGLVDLTALNWPPIELLAGDVLRVAATCTFDELRDHGHPLFAAACDALLGSWKIHRFATVGGNICLALPAGPMTSLMAGLDATAVIWTPDGETRTVPIAEFVIGVRTTCLKDGELLRAIDIPFRWLSARSALRRESLTNLGRSGALVVGTRDQNGFAITVSASTPRPYRILFESYPSESQVVDAIVAVDDWYDDPHGAPDWRAAMTLRLAQQIRSELSS